MGLIRDIRELHPAIIPIAGEWLRQCAQASLPVLVVETRRTWDVSTAYYARGRKPLDEVNSLYVASGLDPISEEDNKRVITNAAPGLSFHIYGLAIDAVPLVDGKPDWNYNPEDPADHFDEIAALARGLGFEWGGMWRSFKDIPHIQYTGGWTAQEAVSWYRAQQGNWKLPVPKPHA